jgi:hypothetical protein
MVDLIAALRPDNHTSLAPWAPLQPASGRSPRITDAIIRIRPSEVFSLALMLCALSGAALFIAATFAIGV